jgi:hypothetical protein
MNLENVKAGKVVLDKFTDKLLTIKQVSKTPDGKDTYVKGLFVNDPDSTIQTRHINDIQES